MVRVGCRDAPESGTRTLTTSRIIPAKQNTETADLINVCNYEHMLHHDEKLDITGDPEGTITFTFPDGRQVRSTAWRQRATAGDT